MVCGKWSKGGTLVSIDHEALRSTTAMVSHDTNMYSARGSVLDLKAFWQHDDFRCRLDEEAMERVEIICLGAVLCECERER